MDSSAGFHARKAWGGVRSKVSDMRAFLVLAWPALPLLPALRVHESHCSGEETSYIPKAVAGPGCGPGFLTSPPNMKRRDRGGWLRSKGDGGQLAQDLPTASFCARCGVS